MTLELSPAEARRVILRAQGLLGSASRKGGVPAMLRRLRAVQLDTISVLARSHELVAYARLGPVARTRVERAYWHNPPTAFEYWCHAACIVPIEDWPLYGFRRREFRERRYRWHSVPDTVWDTLAKIKAEGPLTTAAIGGARRNSGTVQTMSDSWDWSDDKISLEYLLDIGEVACTRRIGWRRVYDVAERVVPDEFRREDPGDAECIARLAGRAGRALGVATRGDLVDFIRVKGRHAKLLDECLADGSTGLTPVRAWDGPAWADPEALEAPPRGRHRTTLLSPFDSLIWHRPRTERVFGFTHRLEAYVPKAKRVYGYFAMPLLSQGKLVGRADTTRDGTTLVVNGAWLDSPRWVEAAAGALREAASWTGCDAVRLAPGAPAAPGLAESLR